MTEPLAIRKVVLYKHGVGYFEREGMVEGDAQVELAFKTSEVSDVLKSLTVLDLDGGHVSSISYDATTPAAKLLEDIALDVSDGRGLVGLLPQLQGAEIEVAVGSERVRGQVIGLDEVERRVDASTVLRSHRLALLAAGGETLQVDLEDARSIRLLDEKLRRDLEFYLRTQLAAKKKDARAFTFFAQGAGTRRLRISYTLETPVWKATYRILLPEAGVDDEPLVQGWAVVDNTQDEDWTEVDLSLISGLPISFVHDLYSARYLRRPVVEVREQSALAPPVVEEAMYDFMEAEAAPAASFSKMAARTAGLAMPAPAAAPAPQARPVSSVDVQTRERQVGDLFQYAITRPVTIKRNQSALVPIVLKPFRGRGVLLYNPATRDRNPLSAVEFENTTGLTLEGGPVTVIEGDTYVGEAMVESIKPAETRLIPYSVELGVLVDSTMQSTSERVHRTRVTRGTLFTYSMERRRTVYQFANKSGRPRTVYVEHRRDYGWELVETTAPHETTPNLYRFRSELPASGAFELAVIERHEISSAFALSSVTPDVVVDYRSARYIDDRVAGVLGAVVALKERAARVDAQMALVAQELAAITSDQQRIRENLKSIGESHDEKQLRRTFVEKLGAQEQRIEELTASHRALAGERQQIQYDIDASIAGLEFETDVRDRAIGRVEILLSAVGYGFIGIFGKRAFASGLEPGEFLTLRFALAASLLWAFVLVTRPRDARIDRRQLLSCVALGVFGYALFTTLYFNALKGLSASLTSLLLYTFPVIVTVAAWALFKEPIGWKRGLALPVVSAGLVMLLWGNLTITNWGAVAFALAAAVFYSVYILASSRLLGGMDSLVAGLYIMTAAAVALAVADFPDPAKVAAMDSTAWGSVVGIATVSTLGPLVLFLRGLKQLTNAEASILSLLEPLTAVVAAAVLLGEQLAPVQLFGGALILAALALSSLGRGTATDGTDATDLHG